MTDQLSMPMPAQPPRRGNDESVATMPLRRRRRCSLSHEEHNAIVFLRHHGIKVEAYGDHWFWTGRKRETKHQLVAKAKAKGWKPGWKFEALDRKAAGGQQKARDVETGDLFKGLD